MPNLDREFLGCGRRIAAEGSGPGVQAALLGVPPVYAPDRPFDTCHIYLDLSVDLDKRRLTGFCRTTIKARRAGLRSLSFDAVDLKIAKVLFDGKPARFKNADKKLVVAAPKVLAEDEAHDIEVHYSVANPEAGLHFVKSPEQMWSQSQPEDARRWFPCHDTPGEKATSEVRATVPSGFRAVSNGVLIDESKTPAKHTFHWKLDRPHSIYLITLAVARFAEVVEDWDGIPVVYYCEKGREGDARRGFGKTAAAMRIFSEKTGVRYPYSRYAQVAVAEYPGGMEHTTATTQTDACLIDKQAFEDHDLDTLVAHELAHQWFGDLVTCAEWPHAWLNEGFATYSEVVFLEADRGHDEALHELLQNRRTYLDEDSGRYRRPIVCRTYTDPWTIFDRHLYEKGCWVLRMLHLELGDKLFWKGVGHWLRKHKDGIVETQDLVAAFEEATGRNLQGFFDQWVYRGGHPALRLRWSWDGKRKRGELHLTQTQDVSDAAPAFKLKARVRVTGRGWTREFTETVDAKEHRFVWTLPGEPVDVEFDPELELLASIKFAKPQAMWVRQLRAGLTSASRGGVWGGPGGGGGPPPPPPPRPPAPSPPGAGRRPWPSSRPPRAARSSGAPRPRSSTRSAPSPARARRPRCAACSPPAPRTPRSAERSSSSSAAAEDPPTPPCSRRWPGPRAACSCAPKPPAPWAASTTRATAGSSRPTSRRRPTVTASQPRRSARSPRPATRARRRSSSRS